MSARFDKYTHSIEFINLIEDNTFQIPLTPAAEEDI